ncbi:response regulator [Actinoplanes sp. NPDC049118]|uniref:response regulator n=1 Tax=Actinoplanes sp. NPDC049118 TaxID=3155769 RepID=UPI0034049D1E
MRWFNDLSIALKIYAAVLVAVVAGSVVGVVGLQKLAATAAASEYLYSQTLVPVAQLGTVQQQVQRSWVALLDTLIAADSTDRLTDLQSMSAADAETDRVFAGYTATDMTGREEAVAQFRASLATLRKVRDEQLVPLAVSGDVRGFQQVVDQVARPALNTATAALEDLVMIESTVAVEKRAATAAAYESARIQMIAVWLAGVLLAFGLAYLIVRGIMTTLAAVARVTMALAAGHSTVSTGVSGRDELGRMAMALDSAVVHRDQLTDELSATVTALRAASAAKSEFLANMSHELRTPLNAIIGFSDLMRTEPTVGQNSMVPTEWIHHIHSSGSHLLGLINEILDLAKVESGQVDLHREPVFLPEAVAEVVASLRALSEHKELEVTVAVASLSVQADRMRLRQIVTNLLSNAIKFTPVGGRIFLAGRRVGAEVALSVADTGPGIAAEDHHRVFEEFQQAGEQGARAQGTGLGLALTRRLVHAHRGRLELESELGHGAKFTVYLPVAQSLATGAGTGTSGSGATGILIMEDDDAAARMLSDYLESAGYDVRVAASGEQGLAISRAYTPEAVLLDLQLPGMDGWEVLTALKGDEQLRHIPVVIISVGGPRAIGMALGAVDYFVKPLSRPALLSWLARHGLVPATTDRTLDILAIDDDPHSLEIIDASLTAEDIRVLRATNGTEGLILARSHRPDLIICDLLMPGMDGFDVVAALHGDPATSGIPVVILTAHTLTTADKARLSAKIITAMPQGQATTSLPELARLVGELTGRTAKHHESLSV